MGTMHGMETLARLGLISRVAAIKKLNKPDLVDNKVRDGSLVPIHAGVYRFRGAAESWQTRALALTLYAGEGSAISHGAAAYLHDLDGFKEPKIIDLLVPAKVQIKPPGALVHRTRESFQIYAVDGVIPTTSLARTLIDLAEKTSPTELEIALNSAWRKNRSIANWIKNEAAKLKRTKPRGLDTLLNMVSRLDDAGLDSGLEVKVLRALIRTNLPTAKKRHIVKEEDGTYVMRLDFAWPDQKVALHVDSSFHQTELAMVRDADQRSRLSVLNWTQVVVMSRTMGDRRWLAQLRTALAPTAPGCATSPSATAPRAG